MNITNFPIFFPRERMLQDREVIESEKKVSRRPGEGLIIKKLTTQYQAIRSQRKKIVNLSVMALIF